MNNPVTQTPSVPQQAASRKRVKVAIDELHPYPQNEYFRQASQEELEILADDIRRNGLRELLEITEDKVLISGHRRWAALQLLAAEDESFAEQTVIVRVDLTDEKAVEQRWLEANLNRRHLSDLKRVDATRRLVLLEHSQSKSKVNGEVREEIGRRINLSGRQVARLLKLLKLPEPLLQLVEDGELTQGEGELYFKIDPDLQDSISALQDPEEILGETQKALKKTRAEIRKNEAVDDPKPRPRQTRSASPIAEAAESCRRFLYSAQPLLEQWETLENMFAEDPSWYQNKAEEVEAACTVATRLKEQFLAPTLVAKKKLLKRKED